MARVVLASRLGGPAETIADGETGWLVSPGDAPAWAVALDQALAMSGPSGRHGRRCAGTDRGAIIRLQRMCEATFALYRRLSEARL